MFLLVTETAAILGQGRKPGCGNAVWPSWRGGRRAAMFDCVGCMCDRERALFSHTLEQGKVSFSQLASGGPRNLHGGKTSLWLHASSSPVAPAKPRATQQHSLPLPSCWVLC